MKRSAENILASYIDALHPIIYINHFDFKVIDAAIAHVGQGAKCVELNSTHFAPCPTCAIAASITLKSK